MNALDHAAFTAYLESLPPDQPFALTGTAYTCPIARYLHHAGANDVAVYEDRLIVDGAGRTLPEWAQAFIATMDVTALRITPREALRALAGEERWWQTPQEAPHA